jgi:hypothetical protein
LITNFSAAANMERHGLFDGRAALDTLLHDDGTRLAGHHVQARLEEDGGRGLATDQTIFNLKRFSRSVPYFVAKSKVVQHNLSSKMLSYRKFYQC